MDEDFWGDFTVPDSLQGVTKDFDWSSFYQTAPGMDFQWDDSSGNDLDGFAIESREGSDAHLYRGTNPTLGNINSDGDVPDYTGSAGSGFSMQKLIDSINGATGNNKGLLQSILGGLGGVYKDMNLKEIAQMGIDSNERRDIAAAAAAAERQRLANEGSIAGINANNAAAMERQRLQMEAIKQRQTDLNNSIQPTKWSA